MILVLGLAAFGLGAPGGINVHAADGAGSDASDYGSSIRVPEDHDDEQNEAARLAPLAKINANQATAAALAKVPGTALKTTLDNENGNLVYSVAVKLTSNEIRDIKVDAGDGRILQIDVGNDQQDSSDSLSGRSLLSPF